MRLSDDDIIRKKPDVFSRGALELTFRLLRIPHPGLALEIQNVLAAIPLSSSEGGNPATDHFYINLDVRSIGKIVSALTKMGQQALDDHNSSENGRRVVLRALMREWMLLAEWIIIQAQDEFSAHH